jgi:hypothetical protein
MCGHGQYQTAAREAAGFYERWGEDRSAAIALARLGSKRGSVQLLRLAFALWPSSRSVGAEEFLKNLGVSALRFALLNDSELAFAARDLAARFASEAQSQKLALERKKSGEAEKALRKRSAAAPSAVPVVIVKKRIGMKFAIAPVRKG